MKNIGDNIGTKVVSELLTVLWRDLRIDVDSYVVRREVSLIINPLVGVAGAVQDIRSEITNRVQNLFSREWGL